VGHLNNYQTFTPSGAARRDWPLLARTMGSVGDIPETNYIKPERNLSMIGLWHVKKGIKLYVFNPGNILVNLQIFISFGHKVLMSLNDYTT
jgi:hypothetical protein